MQVLLLLVFIAICLQNARSLSGEASLWMGPPAGIGQGTCAALVAGGVVLAWLAADLIARSFARRLTQSPWQRTRLLGACSRARRRYTTGLFAGFLLLLYPLGWGRVVEDGWTLALGLPGAELIMLSPLLAALFLSWERFYRVEKAADHGFDTEPFISKANYLLLQMRNNLLIVVPPACLWLIQETLEATLPSVEASRPMLVAFYFGVLLLALVCLPLILRLFLGLRPLPAGPLRERLTQTAQRLRFRCGNILVWKTHRTMANALISGFVPWPRYVILTDRLIEELTPDEIEAVFAHEIGHVRHNHMALYVLFCLASLVLLGAAGGYFRSLLEPLLPGYFGPALLTDDFQPGRIPLVTLLNIVTVVAVLAYFYLVFGFISRRCERQADLFGSRATSSEAFIGALEKVAQVNGIPREQGGWMRSWRHPSIAERVAFVRQASADPHLESRFHRSLRLVKWGVAMSLPGLIAVLWWLGGAERVWALVSSL